MHKFLSYICMEWAGRCFCWHLKLSFCFHKGWLIFIHLVHGATETSFGLQVMSTFVPMPRYHSLPECTTQTHNNPQSHLWTLHRLNDLTVKKQSVVCFALEWGRLTVVHLELCFSGSNFHIREHDRTGDHFVTVAVRCRNVKEPLKCEQVESFNKK